MRERFDKKLELLNNNLISMAQLVIDQINLTVKAIKTQDKDIAKEVLKHEDEVNSMEKTIERLCLNLILHEQPVARDLRLISTAFKMIIDLERIGDQATDICEIILESEENLCSIEKFKYFVKMAEATTEMITKSVKSYVEKDLELARKVIESDDVVDELFEKIKREMIHLIRNTKEDGEKIIDDILIAKYFERIGDHSVNIAEWVIFSITGEHKNTRII